MKGFQSIWINNGWEEKNREFYERNCIRKGMECFMWIQGNFFQSVVEVEHSNALINQSILNQATSEHNVLYLYSNSSFEVVSLTNILQMFKYIHYGAQYKIYKVNKKQENKTHRVQYEGGRSIHML